MTFFRHVLKWAFVLFPASAVLAGSFFIGTGRADEETKAERIKFDREAVLETLDEVIAETDDPQAKSALLHMRVIAQQSAT